MSMPPNPEGQPAHQPYPQAQHPGAYQQPVQQQQQQQQLPPQPPTTLAYMNAYAMVAFITAFIMPLVGIIFGHLALGQIKRNGDGGRGLALAGTIIGYALIGVIILYVVWIFVMLAGFIAVIGELAQFGSSFEPDPYTGEDFDF